MNQLVLLTHIAFGSAALLAGAAALFSRKGKANHRRAGLVFFWAMVVVLATAVLLAAIKNNLFLLCIAVFSFYLTYTGYRAVAFSKQPVFSPSFTDKLVLWASLLVALAMLYTGFMPLLRQHTGMNLVLLVFGLILAANCLLDLRLQIYGTSLPPGYFLLSHIGRMCGAYIATVTAVLVTNVHTEPLFIFWLLPTLVGSPFIALSIRQWRKKLNPVLV